MPPHFLNLDPPKHIIRTVSRFHLRAHTLAVCIAMQTGIASALRAKCTHIATDSACSLSQIRKQLLFPESHRKHTHRELLEQIVSMINESNTPINFYKVKAHIGVIGNEFADAIAKHAALHNYGHDEAFPPPSPDGNPFAHIYWLAEENKETTHTTGMKNDHQRDIKDVHPSRWDVHLIEVKNCDDTRPEQQLARATEQHIGLKHTLAQQCHKVSLHTILIGVMGTINYVILNFPSVSLA